MAAQLPRVLRNFNAYVDGRGFIGRVVTCKLPELTIKTEEHQAGGMDAPVELDMGMEKLEVSISLAEYDEGVIKLFGLLSADTALVLRGSIGAQGSAEVPVIIRMQGGIKQIKRDDWETTKNSKMEIVANCNRYQETVAGAELVNIDILNMVRIIGGVDKLAATRANIGV